MEKGENFFDVLKKLKELGFDGVEFAGYYGYSAEEIKEKLEEYDLIPVGSHVEPEDLKIDKLDETLKFCSILGMDMVGVGTAPHKTIEETIATRDILDRAYKEAAKRGITVYYHTHYDEFFPFSDGRRPIDILMPVCSIEVDTYWSFYAGVDTYRFISENRDRIPLLHIKDGRDGNPCALGEGNNDLLSIAKIAKELNMEWVILENENPEPDGLSDSSRSIKYLRAHF